ncbi:type I toxin-antitoxin system toxin MokC, partial [Escherichia coli]
MKQHKAMIVALIVI